MNKRCFLTSVLILLPLLVFAKTDVREFSFDNGLKLLVKEDHRAPVVVSQVWYKVGGSYEHNGITGISHALEHMMFKGTEKHPSGEFSRIISANGGRENAFTSADYTAYFQTLEKSRLHISFELEADRMRNLLIPEDEFIKEIEVIKEERRMRTDDKPSSYAYEVAMATAYQTSPYRHPTVGWMADLDSMTATDLKAWYRKWYAPNNATVVVVGDIKAEQVYQLAKKYFADLPAEEITSQTPRPEVPQQGIKRISIKRPAEIPYLLLAYKVPVLKSVLNGQESIEEWEPYALDVLAGILDGGGSARFASRLVRGSEVAASAGTNYDLTSRLDAVFIISGTPSRGISTDELEQAFRRELSDLQANLVEDRELQRVKAQVVSQDVYERDSVFYQAMILGILESNGLSWRRADDYVERIQAVTAEQVRAVAGKYFIDDNLTVAVLDPQPLDNQHQQRPKAGGEQHAY